MSRVTSGRSSALIGQCREEASDVAQWRVEQAGRRGKGCGDGAGNLAEEHIPRGKRCQPGHAVGINGSVPEQAPGNPDLLERAHRVDDCLRSCRLVGSEGDCRRADEQCVERRSARVGCGDLHEPVLDDPVRHVLLAQAASDLGDLLDRETPVLRDDERRAPSELLAQLVDDPSLGLGRHSALRASARNRRAAVGARRSRREPLRRSPFRAMALTAGAAPAREGGGIRVPASAWSPSSPGTARSGPAA